MPPSDYAKAILEHLKGVHGSRRGKHTVKCEHFLGYAEEARACTGDSLPEIPILARAE
jgi:hypothetical protein